VLSPTSCGKKRKTRKSSEKLEEIWSSTTWAVVVDNKLKKTTFTMYVILTNASKMNFSAKYVLLC
jgi:hypothetical protein